MRILSDFCTAICPFENMYIGCCVYNAFSDILSHALTQNQFPQELERTEITIPSIQIRKLRARESCFSLTHDYSPNSDVDTKELK